jgi:MFS superfamily sulfate permease-like transporter
MKIFHLKATMECILAGAVGGIMYSLLSGQPLNIISATGPMVILEAIIQANCNSYNINFMTFRLWVGMWTALFLLLIVMFNLSFLVKYITRFTEDSFAALVAIIFIIDAFRSVLQLHPSYSPSSIIATVNSSNSSGFNQPSQMTATENSLLLINSQKEMNFYFSVILFFLTYFVCSSLKGLRNKPYLPSKVS